MAKKDSAGSDATRVCLKCGTARLIPVAMTKDKPPSDRQVAGMQRATKFAIGKQRERYSMQSAALQGQQDRYIKYATCASCGSTEFDEYAPGETVPISAVVAVVAAPTATPLAAPAQWADDPFGRHSLRFHDGLAWTAAVVDGGVPGVDQPST